MNELQTTKNQIRQHARQLVRELDVVRGMYLDTGFTFSQCHILFELSVHESLNLGDLAGNLLIDKSNTSRTVKKLVELGLVRAEKSPSDQRQKLFSLTAKGNKALRLTLAMADQQVSGALEFLTEQEQSQVIQGIRLYSSALRKSRLQKEFTVRPIEPADNRAVAALIRQVMTEFEAVGEGYSIEDPEVDDMHGHYQGDKHCYCVVVKDKQIVGCGGIAPLAGGKPDTCELRKMFFRPEARGRGVGRRLLTLLLDEARQHGFRRCYLETLSRMEDAIELYRKSGFQPLDQPDGNTGHCSCDQWYELKL